MDVLKFFTVRLCPWDMHITGRRRRKMRYRCLSSNMATDSSVDSSTNSKNGATGRKGTRVWMDGWYFMRIYYILETKDIFLFFFFVLALDIKRFATSPTCQNVTSNTFLKKHLHFIKTVFILCYFLHRICMLG